MAKNKVRLQDLEMVLANTDEDASAAKIAAAKAKRERKAARQAKVAEEAVIEIALPVVEPVAPVVEEPKKMVPTTLQEVAKVVPPHKSIMLPVIDLEQVEDPISKALVIAARLRQDSVACADEYKAHLEIKRDLEAKQKPHAPRYLELFGEAFEKWLDEPGHEYRRALMESREPHARKLRAWVVGLINKAMAAQDEAAAEYVRLEVDLSEARRWLQIHLNDAEAKLTDAKAELQKVGVKYEDVFPYQKPASA